MKGLLDRDLDEVTKTHERLALFTAPETVTTTIGGTRLAGLLTLGGTLRH